MIRAGTNPQEGTPPDVLVSLAQQIGLQYDHDDDWSVQDLRGSLDAGHPVLCCVQAYGTPGEYAATQAGHYVVVIGYQGDDLILQDPAAGRVRLSGEEFDRRWRDEDASGRVYDHWGVALWV